MRRALLTIGVLLLASTTVRAQSGEIAIADQPLPSAGFSQPGNPALNGEVLADPGLAPYAEPLGEPPWCESPYRSSAWRFEIDFIPTISHVSEQAFGDWDDNGSLALRLNLGYEDCDGFGTRLAFWGFGQESRTFVDDVDLRASTFYWDFYKRFFVQNAELTVGGGLAGSHLEYELQFFNDKANFSGGGLSVFGEGFYPFLRFRKTDIGSVGRARLALLSGRWEDDGMPFINDTDHDVMTILEVAWGLELRRRFGRREDKYWYIGIVPEFQRWESASLPDDFDPGFQGTNINFGLAW